MKYNIKFFIFPAIVVLFACSPPKRYDIYIAEGRIIDKTTKEPIKDIDLSGRNYGLPQQKNIMPSFLFYTPLSEDHDALSDANGKFRVLEITPFRKLYIADKIKGLYIDTIVFIPDSIKFVLTDRQFKGFSRTYVLNVGDIELEKKKATRN